MPRSRKRSKSTGDQQCTPGADCEGAELRHGGSGHKSFISAFYRGTDCAQRGIAQMHLAQWGSRNSDPHTQHETPAFSPVRWPEREALADLGPEWSQGQLASSVGDMGGREQVSMDQSSS